MKTTKPTLAIKRGRPRHAAGMLLLRELIAHQIGGHLALDFCNTAGEHLAKRPDELLCDWEAFIRWSAQVGLVGPESYSELLHQPEELDGIIQLREAIYRVGLAITGSRPISKGDVAFIRECANAPRPEI